MKEYQEPKMEIIKANNVVTENEFIGSSDNSTNGWSEIH